MRPARPITIVGGGLAGLTLGIGLRGRGIPVVVWEAGQYPRHRVCGEFISGRGQAALTRLDLRETLFAAGAILARTAAFYSTSAASRARELAEHAFSISRLALDDALARRFRALGGELRERERWRGGELAEGMVRATGRRSQPLADGWRWFGLKVHARNVPLAADLEMHLAPGGYLGMNRLPDGVANLCGLFRRAPGQTDLPARWQEILRGPPGTLRHERLANAVFDDASFCSVAGLSLEPQRAVARAECCLGDAITMIPPVTGNGMSMAFESAELALEPLAAYCAGETTWLAARQAIADRCDRAFAGRLAWAGWLQRLMFLAPLQSTLVRFIPRCRPLWTALWERTR